MKVPLGSFARRTARRFQSFLPSSSGGLIILAYHLVDGGTDSPVDLPGKVFEDQMEELRRSFRPVSVGRGLRELSEGAAALGTAVAVTFDDAFANFGSRAWPVLRELGIPATLFVPTGFIDGELAAPLRGAEALPAASWEELRELASEGVEMGSHSHGHPDFRLLRREEAQRELLVSRRRLEAELGREVEGFAYPRALWSREVDAEVRRLYRWAVVAGGRRIRRRGVRPHHLSRLPVRRDMPSELATLLATPLWLEEWAADRWRQLRRPERSSSTL